MSTAAKLTFVGLAGAAAAAAVGAAGLAYNYFTDPELGPERRRSTIELVNNLLDKSGMANFEKNLMQTFMEKMSSK
jgi:hypothetical protein